MALLAGIILSALTLAAFGLLLFGIWLALAGDRRGDMVDEEPTLMTRNRLD